MLRGTIRRAHTSLDAVRLGDGVGDDATARALRGGEEKLTEAPRQFPPLFFVSLTCGPADMWTPPDSDYVFKS